MSQKINQTKEQLPRKLTLVKQDTPYTIIVFVRLDEIRDEGIEYREEIEGMIEDVWFTYPLDQYHKRVVELTTKYNFKAIKAEYD